MSTSFEEMIGVSSADQTQHHEPANDIRPDSASGILEAVSHQLPRLPKAKAQRENADGIQADGSDDPAEKTGSGAMDARSIAQKATAQGVVALIDIATVKRDLANREKARRYIGASSIGNPCNAYQALSMRGFPSDPLDPKISRIMSLGTLLEPLIVNDLIEAGHKVEPVDPATGKQWHFESHGGHHAANLDGFITPVGGERMTLEIKTMNRVMFDNFVRKGLALSHSSYYCQVQDGMTLAKLGGVEVSACMLVAYCKDNSSYAAEIVPYDVEKAEAIMNRVESIVRGRSERQSSYQNHFVCKSCFKQGSCWEPNVTDRSCSHCVHAIAGTSGVGFLCAFTGQKIPDKTCEKFTLWRPSRNVE